MILVCKKNEGRIQQEVVTPAQKELRCREDEQKEETGRNLFNRAVNEFIINQAIRINARNLVNKLQQRLASNRRGSDENGAVKEKIRRQDSR